ncbi:MAG: hypothetical protein ACQEP6_01745 [Patescibacteria group bacterium]
MHKFIKKIKLQNLATIITAVFKRMPVPVLLSVSAFIVMITLIRVDGLSQTIENSLVKLLITLVLSFFFSVALYFFSESRRYSVVKKWKVQIATLVFGALFFYFLEENLLVNMKIETAVYIALTILALACSLFLARFIKKYFVEVEDQDGFYVFSYELVLRFAMSAITGLATMLLGFAALVAIFALFDLEGIDQSKFFGYWASFSLLLLMPTYFLAITPSMEKLNIGELDDITGNKFYSFLVNYAALPAIYVYFIILYTYTLKVLINFKDWPQGEVAWLVILFSFFGYIVYFASSAFEDKFKHAGIFRKIFPVSVLPQTLMLFYAIGLRIDQYDLTINRQFVVVFGLWLFGLSLYYVLSRKKDLSIIFSSLFILVVVVSIGPWSVYVMPEHRQQEDLRANLNEAGILKDDGEIVPLESYSSISNELSGEIYGSIKYLCEAHGCESLNMIFADEIAKIKKQDREDFEKRKEEELREAKDRKNLSDEYIKDIEEREYGGINTWKVINDLSEKLKVRAYNSRNLNNDMARDISFRNEAGGRTDSLEVKGFDYLTEIVLNKDLRSIDEKEDVEDLGYRVYLDIDEEILEIHYDEEIREEFDISESIIETLLEKRDRVEEGRFGDLHLTLPSEEMTFELSGERYDLRVVLTSVTLENPDWNGPEESEVMDEEINIRKETTYSYANGFVLIREKSGSTDI